MVKTAVDTIEVHKKDIRDEIERRGCLRNKGERMTIDSTCSTAHEPSPRTHYPLYPLKNPSDPQSMPHSLYRQRTDTIHMIVRYATGS